MKIKQSILLLLVSILTIFLFTHASLKKEVQVVKMPWLDSILSIQNDTTYVLNFWATWCIPCVAELPVFEKANQKTNSEATKVILINLDYVKDQQKVLIPFLEKKRIKTSVVLLNEPDANRWINLVDSSWSGALPATLIFNHKTSYRTFIEKELNFELLDTLLKTSHINK